MDEPENPHNSPDAPAGDAEPTDMRTGEDGSALAPSDPGEPQAAGRTKAEPVRSLVDLFSVKGANSRKLLRELEKSTSWKFDDGDLEAAMALLPERDPHLARTRQLLHEGIEAYDGRFARAAGDFALRATAPDVDGLSSWPPGETTDPTEALREIAAHVAPRLTNPKERRRAHNVLMIAVDLLSNRRALAFESAAPILREALGKPPEYSERKSNPRRHRVASVTRPSNDLDRVRDLLDLLEPWERELEETERARRDADAAAARAGTEAKVATGRSQRLREELEATKAELIRVRQELVESRDQATDVRIVASADTSELRGRSTAFLNSRLRDLLATAKEASEADPPRAQTAVRLLDQAITEISKEVEWLRSSV